MSFPSFLAAITSFSAIFMAVSFMSLSCGICTAAAAAAATTTTTTTTY